MQSQLDNLAEVTVRQLTIQHDKHSYHETKMGVRVLVRHFAFGVRLRAVRRLKYWYTNACQTEKQRRFLQSTKKQRYTLGMLLLQRFSWFQTRHKMILIIASWRMRYLYFQIHSNATAMQLQAHSEATARQVQTGARMTQILHDIAVVQMDSWMRRGEMMSSSRAVWEWFRNCVDHGRSVFRNAYLHQGEAAMASVGKERERLLYEQQTRLDGEANRIQSRADERVRAAEEDMHRQLVLAGERAIEMRTSYANTVKALQAEYMLKLWRRSIGLWSLNHCACAMHSWSLQFHAYKHDLRVREFGEANLENQEVIQAMKDEHQERAVHLHQRMEKIQLENEVAMDHMRQRMDEMKQANRLTVSKHMGSVKDVEERLEKAKTVHLVKMEELRSEHEKTVEVYEEKQVVLVQDHVQQIDNLDKETELVLARTKAKHDQQVALLEAKLEQMRLDHEEEVARMEEEAEKYSMLQKKKLQDAKAAAANVILELTETNRIATQSNRDAKADFEKDHQGAMDNLADETKNKMEILRQSNQEEVAKLTKEIAILRRMADAAGD